MVFLGGLEVQELFLELDFDGIVNGILDEEA